MTGAAADDQWQEMVTLKMIESDPSAIADILDTWGVRLEGAIRRRYSCLTTADAEDVVSIALWKLWRWRGQYDGSQGRVQTVLFRIARRIAEEWRSGRCKWQQAKLYEYGLDPEPMSLFVAPTREEDHPDDAHKKIPKLLTDLAQVFAELPPLHREIWQAYVDANGYEVSAAELGKELGDKHNGGIPYPATTIRGYKSRAKATVIREMKKKGHDLKALGYTDE